MIRTTAIRLGWALLILVGWCLVMVAYFETYNFAENNAVPVGLPPKDFVTDQWDQGYFQAKGALQNDAAVEAGDELAPTAAYLSCVRASNTCTVTTADVFDRYLNLDSTDYDISTWDQHRISFSSDSAICVISNFAIDRETKTYTQTVRKKAVIPDYAARSPLHPCDGKLDEDISLVAGFPVYWHLLKAYEQRNVFYFHLLLLALNLTYFGVVIWLWRRRRGVKLQPITS